MYPKIPTRPEMDLHWSYLCLTLVSSWQICRAGVVWSISLLLIVGCVPRRLPFASKNSDVQPNYLSFFYFSNEDSRENRLPTPARRSKRRPSWPENVAVTENWEAYARFASTPANIRLGTTSFLAKASIALLLHGTINLSDVNKEACCLS